MQKDIKKSIALLNNGGCIHFAYYFSMALKKANIEHKIWLSNEDPIDIRYDYFNPVAHVMVFIPEIGYIDGYNLYSTKKSYSSLWSGEKYSNHFKLSSVKLDKLRNNYIWNYCYQKTQNSKLEKIIQKHVNGKGRDLYKGE